MGGRHGGAASHGGPRLGRPPRTAIVNAANEVVGGGGGAVNDAGGPALVAARRAADHRGDERRAPVRRRAHDVAGALPVEFVIHAVGPNYRMYTQKEGDGALPKTSTWRTASSTRIRRGDARGGGEGHDHRRLLLLSSGIFRGGRDLSAVLRIALLAVGAHAYDGLEEVSFIAFTQEADAFAEAEALFGGGGPASPSALAAIWSMRRTEPAPTPPAAPVAAPPPPAPAPTPAAVEMSGFVATATLHSSMRRRAGAAAALTFPEPPTSPPAHLAATSARAGSGGAGGGRRADRRLPTAAEAGSAGAGWGEGRACCGARGGLRARARSDLPLYAAPRRGGGPGEASPAPPPSERGRARYACVRSFI